MEGALFFGARGLSCRKRQGTVAESGKERLSEKTVCGSGESGIIMSKGKWREGDAMIIKCFARHAASDADGHRSPVSGVKRGRRMSVRSIARKLDALLPVVLIASVTFQLLLSTLIYREVRGLRRDGLRAIVSQLVDASTGSDEGLPLGVQAPEFTLVDADGTEVSLSDFRGKRAILVFSSSSCPHCRELFDDLKVYDVQYRDQETVLLMLSLATREENRRLKEEEGFTFYVLASPIELAESYQVTGVPFLFRLDAQGRVYGKGMVSNIEQLVAFANN